MYDSFNMYNSDYVTISKENRIHVTCYQKWLLKTSSKKLIIVSIQKTLEDTDFRPSKHEKEMKV